MMYGNSNLRNEYLNQSVMTAGPAELVVMLFDGCIKNLKMAELALEPPKNISRANEYMLKAQNIISELMGSLDMNYEVSKKLLPLYGYLRRSIRTMNVKKDMTNLPAVLEILTSMHDTWEQVASHTTSSSEERVECV